MGILSDAKDVAGAAEGYACKGRLVDGMGKARGIGMNTARKCRTKPDVSGTGHEARANEIFCERKAYR